MSTALETSLLAVAIPRGISLSLEKWSLNSRHAFMLLIFTLNTLKTATHC